MSTSSENKDRGILLEGIIITVFCVVFAFIYNIFSHDVHSWFLNLAFLVSLVFLVVPGLILKNVKHKDTVPMAVRLPMIYGVLTVIAGLLMRGIIDIAGTDSPYIFIYFPVGSIIYLSSPVIAYIIGRKSASVQ